MIARDIDTPARPHLALLDLRKVYAGHRALDGVDLDVAAGEFIALLGPSGCGKTTLLRCIAGLVTPSGGDIVLDGRSILRVPVHGRDIGMAFQSYALFPHMTVSDNIGFGLRMRRVGRSEAARRVAQALDLVRLRGLEDRYPHQLSGGQQQRVAMARAIVTNPKVLLLDEPLAALDAKLREAMQIELRQLQRRLGITTIFVTHDQSEALGMADRVALIRDGRVEQFDAPATIYDKPRTAFVAEFIGQTNQFGAEIAGVSGDQVQLRVPRHERPLLATQPAHPELGGRVVAMIRPEKLEIGEARTPATQDNRLEAVVKDVLFTGDRITIHLDTPVGPMAAAVQNRQAGRPAPVAGEAVAVSWRAADVLLFPTEEKGSERLA